MYKLSANFVHDLINEPQLPWLQTAIIYMCMGLEDKIQVTKSIYIYNKYILAQ